MEPNIERSSEQGAKEQKRAGNSLASRPNSGNVLLERLEFAIGRKGMATLTSSNKTEEVEMNCMVADSSLFLSFYLIFNLFSTSDCSRTLAGSPCEF